MKTPLMLLLAAAALPLRPAAAAGGTGSLDPLAAAVEERIAGLEGDPSPGAAASLRALEKARALLARDATTILKEAKVAAAAAKALEPVFPAYGELLPLLEDAVLGLPEACGGWGAELARLAEALPPDSKEGAAAAAAKTALDEALGAMEGPPAPADFLSAVKRAGKALAKGRRVVGGKETWIAATATEDGAFTSRTSSVTMEYRAETSDWYLTVVGTDGSPAKAHVTITLGVAALPGPGAEDLRGEGYGIYGVFRARNVGVNYNTLGGTGAGGTLLLDRFDPEAGIAEGTFSMACGGGGKLYVVTGAFRARVAD